MRRVMISPCQDDHIFNLCDPDGPTETEFEAITLRAFGCLFPHYRCVVFGGSFVYDNEVRKPDLAMIARDRSHWFIVEVELVSHSLERHVLPQVRAFCYGDAQDDCAGILARELSINIGEAQTIVHRVPRAVVVIANRARSDWEQSIHAHQGQLLVISRFANAAGREAFEVNGSLAVVKESLGFGVYSATDSLLKFKKDISLPDGHVQIEMFGVSSLWKVYRDSTNAWLEKDVGRADLPNGAYVQLIRSIDGRISLYAGTISSRG